MKKLKTIGFVVWLVLGFWGLFWGGIVVLRIVDEVGHAANYPSENIKTAADYYQWQKPTGDVQKGEIRGATYYLVRGPKVRRFSAGLSAYLFDSKGNLVSWTLEIDDDRNGIIRDFYPYNFPTIPVEQFLKEVGASGTL